MSILCKVVLKSEAGVPGGGVKKYYASANVTEVIDLELLSEYVAEACTVHGADVRAVLYATVKVINRELANSKSIELAELGTMRVEVSSKGVDTPEEMNASCIKKSRIVFSPGKLIKKMLKMLDFKFVFE